MRKPFTPDCSAPTSVKHHGRNARIDGPQSRHGASPREFVIRNLMNYSRSLTVLTTSQTGVIHAVLN